MNKICLLLFSLACLLVISACGQRNEAGPSAAPARVQMSGEVERLYKNNCMSCHGTNLEGRIGESTNLQTIGGKLSKEQIVNQIAEGSKNMRGFKNVLSEDEINTLAEWLASQK